MKLGESISITIAGNHDPSTYLHNRLPYAVETFDCLWSYRDFGAAIDVGRTNKALADMCIPETRFGKSCAGEILRPLSNKYSDIGSRFVGYPFIFNIDGIVSSLIHPLARNGNSVLQGGDECASPFQKCY